MSDAPFKTLTRVGELFTCAFCKKTGCSIAREAGGRRRHAVLHPEPYCTDFIQLDAIEFAEASGVPWPCKCEIISGANVMPGWGCCRCRVYNGDGRAACKRCDHRPRPHPYGLEVN